MFLVSLALKMPAYKFLLLSSFFFFFGLLVALCRVPERAPFILHAAVSSGAPRMLAT